MGGNRAKHMLLSPPSIRMEQLCLHISGQLGYHSNLVATKC